MVIAPANTGRDNNNSTAVTAIAHTNNGNFSYPSPKDLILLTVANKLIAPNRELIPAKCKETIKKSTLAPLCDTAPAKGGYLK
jgi:hypothetical protein